MNVRCEVVRFKWRAGHRRRYSIEGKLNVDIKRLTRLGSRIPARQVRADAKHAYSAVGIAPAKLFELPKRKTPARIT
jgi:hypothetical protein